MAAGIDYIIFDTTNGYTYPEVVRTVLETLLAFQCQGLSVPKVSFYTHAVSDRTVHILYEAFYAGGKYDSLWYRPRGKPMIVGVTRDNKGSADMRPPLYPMYVRDAYCSYFDVREAQWPTMPTDPASFPWMSWSYPQEIHDGVVSVPAALLGLPGPRTRFSFKVSDHLTRPFDRMDYYISGDSAPIGALDFEVTDL